MKKNKMMINGKSYREVRLGETNFDRYYKNPLTKKFQYEYALFTAISDLFESVKCKSMCIDSLKLYFKELPHTSEQTEGTADTAAVTEKKKNTQEALLAEMTKLVARDVVGSVTFPMMHICQAEVQAIAEHDGSHTLLFTDGIYGFTAHLDMPGKGHPKMIAVKDISALTETETIETKAAPSRAA